MISPNFVYVGATCALVGISLYAIEMFHGRARPNRMSWLLWGAIPLITFAASLSEGAGMTAILPLVLAVGDLAIFGLSFFIRQSYWRTTPLDIVCGGLSVAAVVLWLITRSGDIAIMLSIAADFLACAPTLVKAYRDPESEHALTYGLSGVGALLTVLTVSTWTLANAGFAVYLLAVDALIVIVITVVHRRAAPPDHTIETEVLR